MQQIDTLGATFGALSDPTRRAIIERLARGPASVGELAAPFDISLPAVSRHLKVLEGAGIIRRETDAQWRRCSLQTAPLKEAADWVNRTRRFWEDSFDALAQFLEQTAETNRENGNDQPTSNTKSRPKGRNGK